MGRPRLYRRARRRVFASLSCLVAVISLLFGGIVAFSSAASASGVITWGTAASIASGASIDDIACPSASFCVAVDGGGKVWVSTNPAGGASAWSNVYTDTGNGLDAVSCPSSGLCVAADDAGNVLTSTSPASSSWAVTNLSLTNSIDSVSCVSATFCVAGDSAGNVYSTTNPTGAASAWPPAHIDGTGDIDSMSCPTVSLCVGVDDGGNVLASTNPTGGASAWLVEAVSGSAFEGVSCVWSALCVAVGDAGTAYTTMNPGGGSSAWSAAVIDSHPLFGVSCGSTTLCVAVDNIGQALVSFNPQGGASTWDGGSIDSTAIYNLTCVQALCIAGDGNGYVIPGIGTGLPQSIGFTSTPPSTLSVGDTYTVSAVGGVSGNPVTFSAIGSPLGMCSVSGSVVSFSTGGTCTIGANQGGNANFEMANRAQQVFDVASLPTTTTTTTTTIAPPKLQPVIATTVKATRGVAVIQLACFNSISCVGSFKLTHTVTQVVVRGHRNVRLKVVETLGTCSVGVSNSQVASIRMPLTKVGRQLVAVAMKGKRHSISAQLLYTRRSPASRTTLNVVLKP